MKNINAGTYVLELPDDLGINPIFNVEDLTIYYRSLDDEGYYESIQLPARRR